MRQGLEGNCYLAMAGTAPPLRDLIHDRRGKKLRRARLNSGGKPPLD